MCAGEGSADGAADGAEEERGVSERSASLREESQRADVPGLKTSQVISTQMFCWFYVLRCNFFLFAVRGGQEDSAEDAGAHR